MAQEENNKNIDPKSSISSKVTRRDWLKGLASAPVVGVVAYDFYKKKTFAQAKVKAIQNELGLNKAPSILPETTYKSQGDLIRIGLVGAGGRGTSLLRSIGFADPLEIGIQIEILLNR